MEGKIYINQEKNFVNKGNFSFLCEINEKLFRDFNEAEKVFKVNYRDCISKLRIAIETFTNLEINENNISFNKNDSLFRKFESILTARIDKTYLAEQCKEIIDYNRAGDENKNINQCMRKLRNMTNMEHHSGNSDVKKIDYTENDVYLYLRFLFNLLTKYYGKNARFRNENLPISNYYPVSQNVCELVLHVQKLTSKRLYVQEKGNHVKYYLISMEHSIQNRDLEILRRIWDDEEKTEISKSILMTENQIQGINDKFYVFSLPGEPTAITSEIIINLSDEEKRDIIKSLLEGMYILHNANPPIYHRHISTDTFYLCRGKNGYVVKWVNFEYSKDYTAEVEKSVGAAWYELFRKPQELFFAPELKNRTRSIDLEKADIYSLGKFILFVMTGEILEYSKIKSVHMQKNVFPEKFSYILYMMLQYDPAERPTINEIIDAMKDWEYL